MVTILGCIALSVVVILQSLPPDIFAAKALVSPSKNKTIYRIKIMFEKQSLSDLSGAEQVYLPEVVSQAIRVDRNRMLNFRVQTDDISFLLVQDVFRNNTVVLQELRAKCAKSQFRLQLKSGRILQADKGVIGEQIVDKNDDVCLHPDCLRSAVRIMDSIDTNIDPCDDFYNFACGKWNRMHAIPRHQTHIDMFSQLQGKVMLTLKRLLKAIDRTAAVSRGWENKLVTLYDSCMNTEIVDDLGGDPILKTISDMGGWSILGNASADNVSIVQLLTDTGQYMVHPLLNVYCSVDDKNSSYMLLTVDQPELSLRYRYYYLRRTRKLVAYRKFAEAIPILLGANTTTVGSEMKEVIDLEVEIAKIMDNKYARRQPKNIYNKFKFGDIVDNFTSLDLGKLINTLLSKANMTLRRDDYVMVNSPNYVAKLNRLLNRTSPRTVKNFIIWKFVFRFYLTLSREFLDVKHTISKNSRGVTADRARWWRCIEMISSTMGMALGRLFIDEQFDLSAKHKALDMIGFLRSAFIELLDEVPWMDQHTKELAKVKAHLMKEQIGFPDYILDDSALSQQYGMMQFRNGTFYENLLSHNLASFKRLFGQLHRQVHRSTWGGMAAPAAINAFYQASHNEIVFPGGIFQTPFYERHCPSYLNFGGIGMVIGHELTHGFDDRGRLYNPDGDLKDWWSKDVSDRFQDYAKCFVYQYSNYSVQDVDVKVDGRHTLSENIADNGGLKQAFRAYRNWVSGRGKEEPSLPGLNLTQNQLFFVNFAQIWCSNSRTPRKVYRLKHGKHSLPQFRVIGPVTNLDEFAETFQCARGTKMNPDNKCVVW